MQFQARIQPNVGLGRTERIELSNYDLQRAAARARPAPAHHGGGLGHLAVSAAGGLGIFIVVCWLLLCNLGTFAQNLARNFSGEGRYVPLEERVVPSHHP